MRQPTPHNHTRRHPLNLAALFFFLCSVYLVTYNGRIFSNDEFQALDITTSLTLHGDLQYDEFTWYVWDNYNNLATDPNAPLPESPNEPGISLLGVPLYALSRLLPGVGSAHTMLLLNVFIGAAACVLMALYARLLGYADRVAIAAALLLGLATTLWPYTRTFLREPAVLLFLLLAAYLLELARRHTGWRTIALISSAAMAVLGAYLTKETALFVVSGLALIAVPEIPALSQRKRVARVLDIALLLVIAATMTMAFTDVVPRLVSETDPLIGSYRLQPDFFQTAFHSYLFSVGGSIWGTSPVLLLALPGAWMLIRRGQRRYVWVMVVCVIGFAFAHALTAGRFWFGGAAWPTRFLIPVIPFMLIPALPVLDALLHARWSTSLRVVSGGAIALIIAYSLWWQFVAASIWWYSYATVMPAASLGLNEWLPGINRIEYLRPLLATSLIWDLLPDYAWIRTGGWTIVPLLAVALVVTSALLLVGHRLPLRLQRIGLILLPVAFSLMIFVNLRALHDDPEYLGNLPELFQVIDTIDAEEQPGDVVVLDTPRFDHFVLNYSRVDHARFVSFPGTVNNTGGEPLTLAVADLPRMLEPLAPSFLNALTQDRDHIWLWIDSTPMGLRPLERAMVAFYYPVQEINTEPPQSWSRLIQFNTTLAPDPVTQPAPGVNTDARFGAFLELTGVTLPNGDTYTAGDTLPITLHWQSLNPVDQSYRVALFLVDANGAVLAQGQDSPIMQGLLPFRGVWEAAIALLDNRALSIPDTLPPGEYGLWLRLYSFDQDGQIATLPVANGQTAPDFPDMAVLPVTIQVDGS